MTDAQRAAMRRRRKLSDKERAAQAEVGMTPEQRIAFGRLRRAMEMIVVEWGPVEGRAILTAAFVVDLVELLQGQVGPQFVELFNRGIAATPYQLTKRPMN